jgi:hypothetical protein
VLDRGFSSTANLAKLAQAPLTFILPVVRSVKVFSALLARHTRHLSHPASACVWQDAVPVHAQKAIEIAHIPLQTHLDGHEQSRSAQTVHFF